MRAIEKPFGKARNSKKLKKQAINPLSAKYWGRGRKFLKNFKPFFYKVKGNTYLIDIEKTYHEAPLGVGISVSLPAVKKEGRGGRGRFRIPSTFSM